MLDALELSAKAITRFAQRPDWPQHLLFYDQIESTQDALKKTLTDHWQNHLCCVADQQSAGRGRLGREWISPARCNLYVSLAWKNPNPTLRGLSLVIACAICEQLRALGCTEAFIKWPNDIWCAQGKIAGILLEVLHTQQVIIGFGLNVYHNPLFSKDFAYCSLQQLTGQAYDRNQLCAQIIDRIFNTLDEYQEKGFKPFFQRWPQYDFCYNKNITFRFGKESRTGHCLGIDEEGRLLIQHNGICAYTSGEIQEVRLLTEGTSS
jgi:BirA family biotin operon repressor/biotin-[acetyl-CoA-carboxylase] ligase